MSVTSSTSVVTVGGGGDGCYYRPPFTAVQWQELELQAMWPIVPFMGRKLTQSQVGAGGQMGRSGDVQKMLIQTPNTVSGTCIEAVTVRYIHGFCTDSNSVNFSAEVSGSVRSLGVGSDMGSTWSLHPSQSSSGPLQRSQHDQLLLGLSAEKGPGHSLDPLIEATLSKQKEQQVYLWDNEICSLGPLKQEKHAMRPFFDEWPSAKESWSNLDEVGSEKSTFSISIPMPTSEFSHGNACSPNGI